MSKNLIELKNKLVKVNKEKIDNFNKVSRIIYFIIENNNNSNKKEILDSYLNKYSLSSKSNNYNKRVIERVFGVYSKYNKEKKEEKKKELIENLKVLNIDYKELIESYKKVDSILSKRNILKVGEKIEKI